MYELALPSGLSHDKDTDVVVTKTMLRFLTMSGSENTERKNICEKWRIQSVCIHSPILIHFTYLKEVISINFWLTCDIRDAVRLS